MIRLLPLGAPTIAALAKGDFESAKRHAPVPLTPYFARPEWRAGWGRAHARVLADPAAEGWLADIIWCETLKVAIGRAGFHGLPEDGVAELTYTVAPEYRRRGYARAALSLLVTRCVAAPEVNVVRAIIRPDNTASRQLVSAAGFTQAPSPDLVGGLRPGVVA